MRNAECRMRNAECRMKNAVPLRVIDYVEMLRIQRS